MRQVSTEEALYFTKQNSMIYFETSAKLNKNIDELLTIVIEEIYDKYF